MCACVYNIAVVFSSQMFFLLLVTKYRNHDCLFLLPLLINHHLSHARFILPLSPAVHIRFLIFLPPPSKNQRLSITPPGVFFFFIKDKCYRWIVAIRRKYFGPSSGNYTPKKNALLFIDYFARALQKSVEFFCRSRPGQSSHSSKTTSSPFLWL